MSGGGFTKEQLDLARQLQAGYRSSGSFCSQPGTQARRPQDGLCRPLPAKSLSVSQDLLAAASHVANLSSARQTSRSSSRNSTPSQPDKRPVLQPHPPSKFRSAPKPEPYTGAPPSDPIRTVQPPSTFIKQTGVTKAPTSPRSSHSKPSVQNITPAARSYEQLLNGQEKTHKFVPPADAALESKKDAAASKRSDGDWKPSITYYSEEPKMKSMHPPAQPQVGHNVRVCSSQTKLDENLPLCDTKTAHIPMVDDNSRDRMQIDDLINFAPSASTDFGNRGNRGNHETHSTSGNADLLSDVFGKVSVSEGSMGFEAMSPSPGWRDTYRGGGNAPPSSNVPNGVREALEINKSGKAVTWNWSGEAPQVREVTEEECKGLQPSPALDGFISKRWDRPWLPQQKQSGAFGHEARNGKMSMEVDMGISPEPARNVGLKGSRHNR